LVKRIIHEEFGCGDRQRRISRGTKTAPPQSRPERKKTRLKTAGLRHPKAFFGIKTRPPANVEIIIQEWIETAKELGRPIPAPRGRLAFA
jgi:hypothetical protein